MTAFAWFGAVAALILALAALAIAWGFALGVWQGRRDRPRYDRLRGRIDTMDRWCSYEYPIVEAMARYLLDGGDISNVRDDLRRKYPTKVQP